MRCGVPIIPVGHTGTLDVQPPGQFTMTPRKKVTIHIGAPLYVADFGAITDPRTHRRMIDAVMFEIAALSGQSYVDTYAGKKDAAHDDTGTRPTAPDQAVTVTPTRPTGRANGMPQPADETATSTQAPIPTRPRVREAAQGD